MTLHDQLVAVQHVEDLREGEAVICAMSPEISVLHQECIEATEACVCAWHQAERLQQLAQAKLTLMEEAIRLSNERFESAEAQGLAPGIRKDSEGNLVLVLEPARDAAAAQRDIVEMLQEIIQRLSAGG